MPNMNTPEYLRKVRETVLSHLKELQHAPSVQMQQVPVDHFSDEDVEEDEDKFKDERITQRERDQRVVRANEYEDSDDEGTGRGGRKGNKVHQSYRDPAAPGGKPAQQPRSMMGGYKPQAGPKKGADGDVEMAD